MKFREMLGMTLKDISNGPSWTSWVGFAIFAIISIVFLSGHGKNLIAGYNTAGKEEQDKYDAKKLCRVVGGGMGIIAILILIMTVGEEILPAYFAYISLAIIILDSIVMIVLANTICKK